MEHEEGVLYRMVYGLAHQLHEAQRYDAQYGRHHNNPAAGGDVNVLFAEVVEQLRLEDPAERELVEDVVEGWRPRW